MLPDSCLTATLDIYADDRIVQAPNGDDGFGQLDIPHKFFLFVGVDAKVDLNDSIYVVLVDTLREETKFCKQIGGLDMRLDVKIAILKSGRRQYEIAQELGVPESTLSKYVRGYGVLSQDHTCKLAQLIGLPQEGSTRAEANHGHTPDAA
jgi:hypothetical protein